MPSSSLNFDVAGGANNVHLLNQTAAGLNHWRTLQGEIYFDSVGRGFFTRFMQNEMGNKIPKQILDFDGESMYTRENLLQFAYAETQIKLPLPGIPAIGLTSAIHYLMRKDFTPDKLVSVITSANKPDLVLVDVIDPETGAVKIDLETEMKVQEQRTDRALEWDEVVQSWFSQRIYEKTSDLEDANPNVFSPMTEDGDFDPLLVTKDFNGSQQLTEAGTRLLLWDMGIIQPTEDAREEAKN